MDEHMLEKEIDGCLMVKVSCLFSGTTNWIVSWFSSSMKQLVVDKMILHPYKNCTFELMEQLECE